jgi:biotin-(acetyl-CoA carboxylase) ligase
MITSIQVPIDDLYNRSTMTTATSQARRMKPKREEEKDGSSTVLMASQQEEGEGRTNHPVPHGVMTSVQRTIARIGAWHRRWLRSSCEQSGTNDPSFG